MSANVLVVHGGGPTAVINASLYGVVEEAKSSGRITEEEVRKAAWDNWRK